MTIKPINDNIVVTRQKADGTSAGGIAIPDAAQQDHYLCTVMAVGPGRLLDTGKRAEMPVKVGDKIVLQPLRLGYPTIADGKFILIATNDVFGIVE